MKVRRAISAILVGCLALTSMSCSKVSNGVPPAPTASKYLKGADGPPLWFVNNVEVGYLDEQKGKLKIAPDQIERVTVLPPASNSDLVSRYGAKGKNGVVLVETKQAAK